MRAVDVHDLSQVAQARRLAVAEAQSQGFGETDRGRVALVVTELASNIVKHGGGGAILLGHFSDETGTGVECLALDRGPGLGDVPAAFRDGHSTAGTPGTGLGAVMRGAQTIDVYSSAGGGTAILARLSAGDPGARPAALPSFGALCIPMPGEECCGDTWSRKGHRAGGWLVMVADGLGHGPMAAEASHAAAGVFGRLGWTAPSDILANMHAALRPTRGAAVSIARVEPESNTVVFAGVGNVAAVIVDASLGVRRLLSNNGTIGHIARQMRDYTYAIDGALLLILTSDGLSSNWRLDGYPGLVTRHPSLIAGVLYRDHCRNRDDVTVWVGRLDG